MQNKISATAAVALGWLFLAAGLRAQTMDVIGVTALRSAATNLNGAGIRVAQPEAGDGALANWEVNPATVSQPTNLFTYISTLGSATTYPNLVGAESGHAGEVGRQFYSPVYGVATNVAHDRTPRPPCWDKHSCCPAPKCR